MIEDGMNYFPYVAMLMVVFLGYWYVSGLNERIHELEARNAIMGNNLKIASTSLKTVGNNYETLHRRCLQCTRDIVSLNAKIVDLHTRIQRSEKYIGNALHAHEEVVRKLVNDTIDSRLKLLAELKAK